MIIFNSWNYVFFLLGVWSLHWILPGRFRNHVLLAASYIFYGSWDSRFLSLILFSTALDYAMGHYIAASPNPTHKKLFLCTSLIGNLGLLGIFKYFGFFTESFIALLNQLGFHPDPFALHIILPVGISFYTFQTLSYSIDIYLGKIKPTRGFLVFAVFVAFFPQLVAGPIERAKRLLPQLTTTRTLKKNHVFNGIDLILWGLVKKIVIADNVAFYVNMIFDLKSPSSLLILVGAIGFGIQILADFSAYADIARGSAKLFGIEIMENFLHPYIAKSPSDFWRRWHISLSLWIRDYIYFPLGGSRCNPSRYVMNIFITWFLCGVWHGAAWNFVAWGLYHGALILIYHFATKPFEKPKPSWFSTVLSVTIMYILSHIGWLIFRSPKLRGCFKTAGTSKRRSASQLRCNALLCSV